MKWNGEIRHTAINMHKTAIFCYKEKENKKESRECENVLCCDCCSFLLLSCMEVNYSNTMAEKISNSNKGQYNIWI